MDPDLLLVIVDDLRADRLGCAGLRRAETPFLDGLAARGVRFSHCWSTTGWTLPACASIVTGLPPSGHGLLHHDRRFAAPKIPALLGAGRATLGIGNNGNLVPDDIPVATLDALGLDRRPEVWKHFGWQEGFERYDWFPKQDKDGPFAAFARWMEGRSADPRPWFAMLHTNLTHDYDRGDPWCVDVERFLGAPLHPALREFRDGPWVWKDPPAGLDDPALAQQLLAKYDGCIAETDRRLAQALGQVDLDRTVVCVVSDHGEGFDGDAQRVHHCGRLHDDLLRVPLILVLPPGIDAAPAPGTVIDTPCSILDVAPTLLRIAGRAAHGLPGADLLDLPPDRALPVEDFGYLYPPPGDATERLRRYEYKTHDLALTGEVRWPRKRVRARLGRQEWEEEYDLESDPFERVNLAPGPHRPLRRPRKDEGAVAATLRGLKEDSDEARILRIADDYPRFARRIRDRRKLPPVERHRSFEEIPEREPITFIVAVDDPAELRRHVQVSACYRHGGHQWILVENRGNRAYRSISKLYRDAARRARHDLRFHVHQDVLFPPDWEDRLCRALADLERRDPHWGVIGAAGRAPGPGAGGEPPPNVGHWSDPHRYHRPRVPMPAEVQILDELWLGFRASRGVDFDPELPGFHCYGADLCLSARDRGLRSWVVDAPVVHKLFRPDGTLIEASDQSHKIAGRATDAFRADFRRSAEFVAAKFAHHLPFDSTCHAYRSPATGDESAREP